MTIGQRYLLCAAAVLSCAGAAEAAPNDNFCTALKAIVADAPNSFASFKGALTQQVKSEAAPYDMMDHYAATGAPDGAQSCEIVTRTEATSDGQRYPNYSCQFAVTGSDKGAATRKLARRSAACLPGTSRPIGPGRMDKDGGMLTAHSSDYTVSYLFISGPMTTTINLSIQSERK